MNVFPNAKFALVIAEWIKNEQGSPHFGKWQEFQTNLPRFAPRNAETKMIHENVWLIPLDSGMRFLCQLFEFASGMGISLRILFLDSEPEWLQYPKSDESEPS
jgi:hypothetical protein